MTDFAFGVQYATTHSASSIEDWLSDNCKGDWEIRLAGLDEAHGRKTWQIFFELEADKDIFKTGYASHKP